MRGHAPLHETGEFSAVFIAEKPWGINGTAERRPEGQSLGQGRLELGQAA